MSEALTTQRLTTIDLLCEFFGGGLKGGDSKSRSSACRKVCRLMPAISAALDWEIIPTSYHLTTAATSSSWANSSGLLRRAEKALSGRLS